MDPSLTEMIAAICQRDRKNQRSDTANRAHAISLKPAKPETLNDGGRIGVHRIDHDPVLVSLLLEFELKAYIDRKADMMCP